MKEFALAAAISGSLMAGVAMMTVPGGKLSDGHASRVKGRASSYRDASGNAEAARASGTGGQALQVALKGSAQGLVFLRLDFDYDFLPGPGFEAQEIDRLSEERRHRLDHALHIHLSEFDVASLDDGAGKYELKRMLRDLVQRELFARDEALVDDVLFRELTLQHSR